MKKLLKLAAILLPALQRHGRYQGGPGRGTWRGHDPHAAGYRAPHGHRRPRGLKGRLLDAVLDRVLRRR